MVFRGHSQAMFRVPNGAGSQTWDSPHTSSIIPLTALNQLLGPTQILSGSELEQIQVLFLPAYVVFRLQRTLREAFVKSLSLSASINTSCVPGLGNECVSRNG